MVVSEKPKVYVLKVISNLLKDDLLIICHSLQDPFSPVAILVFALFRIARFKRFILVLFLPVLPEKTLQMRPPLEIVK